MQKSNKHIALSAIGQIVYSSVSDGTNESINLIALADGIYLVKVKIKESEAFIKIVKD